MRTEYATNNMMMNSVRKLNLLTHVIDENEDDHFKVSQTSEPDEHTYMLVSSNENFNKRDYGSDY